MKTQPHSEKFKRHRKFLLVLPLFVLPFLVTTFWALGGGNPTVEIADDNAKLIGTLPSPEIEEKPMDKLSLFEKAKKDSSNRQKQYTQDPYADFFQIKEAELESQDIEKANHLSPIIESTPMKAQEEKIRQQLDQLQAVLDQPDVQPASQKALASQKEFPIALTGDIDRLEAMMQRMSQRDEDDPEMRQVEDMLEKILDIQHPQRVQDRLREKSREEKGKVFPIHTESKPLSNKNQPKPSSLELADDELDYTPAFTQSKQINGFYGLEEESVSSDDNIFAVPAVIHGEQTLTAGATVKMRLTRDIYVNGMRIPSGSFVFGTCGIQGERLEIAVDGIRHGEVIFPISLTVYDMDAISGIRIPGAITRESVKEGTASAIQGTQFMGFNPSIEAQAANAGIEAAKGLFSKKAKLIRVTVKDTHPILLVDQNQRHQ
ncbi:conjugative transposon protein TraM [Belliella sp. DSM 111904]|uniref:Conjugative transposon protein TraM n=1 Tax=Belliella filtrata TaxID=2923435 RepID=A0ABS9V1B7_9BACT|nr:conjugative transposon protein TraM [Belliella filtrata]MCH7410004.1 conjugative transposon protein TraM [Belliella filtrata]